MTWTCTNCGAQSSEHQYRCPFCKKISGAITYTASGITYPKTGIYTTTQQHETIQPEAELVAEPVVGWREWGITTTPYDYYPHFVIDEIRARIAGGDPNPMAAADTPFLKAVGQNIIWPFTHTAKCTKNASHEAPVWHCTCGIYAHKKRQFTHQPNTWERSPQAWGSVQLWGTIIEHETGYRAQHAKPQHIETVGITIQQATLLSEAYDCCVTCHYPLDNK